MVWRVPTSSFADLDYSTTLDGTGTLIAIGINAPQEILLFASALASGGVNGRIA